MRRSRILLNAAVVTLSAAAVAQAAEDPARRQLESIVLCRNIAEDAARLACFDKAVPGTVQVLQTPPPMTEQQVAEKREEGVSLFGLRLWGGEGETAGGGETPETFGQRTIPEEQRVAAVDPRTDVSEITMGVIEAATTPEGRMIFVLENGQVWRSTESMSLSLPKDPAYRRVRIREGMIGGYLLSVAGQNQSYRVRRVQ